MVCIRVAKVVWACAGMWVALMEYLMTPCSTVTLSLRWHCVVSTLTRSIKLLTTPKPLVWLHDCVNLYQLKVWQALSTHARPVTLACLAHTKMQAYLIFIRSLMCNFTALSPEWPSPKMHHQSICHLNICHQNSEWVDWFNVHCYGLCMALCKQLTYTEAIFGSRSLPKWNWRRFHSCAVLHTIHT